MPPPAIENADDFLEKKRFEIYFVLRTYVKDAFFFSKMALKAPMIDLKKKKNKSSTHKGNAHEYSRNEKKNRVRERERTGVCTRYIHHTRKTKSRKKTIPRFPPQQCQKKTRQKNGGVGFQYSSTTRLYLLCIIHKLK